jgi:hypothetical protein
VILRPHHDRPAMTRAITGQRAPRPGPPYPGRGHGSPSASVGPPSAPPHVLPTCRCESLSGPSEAE